MTDTTQDYAGLIEMLRSHKERWECAGGGGWETPEVCIQAATALRALLERNAALERERAARDRWFQTHVACGELGMVKRAAEAEARVKELEAENARLSRRRAEADRVIDMVEEDPALARALARAYRDKGRE